MYKVERVTCPVCKVKSSGRHCNSKQCYWMSCNKCTTSQKRFVIFDLNGHYFYTER